MAENCIEINNKNLQSWLFSSSRNQDKANIVVDYFNPKEGETPTPFESFILALTEKGTPKRTINNYIQGYEYFKTIADKTPVENTSQESASDISTDLILESKQTFIDDVFTFASKHEGLSKLFKDKDHIYQKYSWFMSKFLISHMFYNNTQTKQISNSQELKVHLVGLINFYASVLDPARFTTNDSLGKDDPRKPFLKITYDFTKNITITSNKSDWYYLNHLLNETLKNANFNILKDLKYVPKSNMDPNIKKLVVAVSYANFNTVLQEYLPGVITVNSSLPGFDFVNINNDNLYVLNGSSLGKGWQTEGKVFDSNSSLAKLLLNSFETITAYKDKNGNFALNFQNNPNFSVAIYYYVSLFLSKHINKQNYANEFNNLLTALMLFNVPYNTDSLLRHLTNTRPETVGRFNYDYINEDVELKEIFKDTTLYSVVATLYYNMATIDEDPILTKFNFDKDIAEAALNKISLAKIYKKHVDSSMSSIHDLIFATLQGTTERLYHDLTYDFEKRIFSSKSLALTVVNKSIFEVQKMHRNLISLSDERRDSLFPEKAVVPGVSLSILVNGAPVEITVANKRWVLPYDSRAIKQIYEVFYQLTNFDLTQDFMLKENPAFNLQNIVSVIYGMLAINDDPDAKLRYREENKALGEEIWSKYSPTDNVNSILYQMGALYGKLTGVMSKMTILNKDGKQLPTFGMRNISSSYDAYLLEALEQPLLKGNIFTKNPKLYVGSSIKNQIVKDGSIVNVRESNDKDAAIFDIYFEWLQKHFYNEKLVEGNNSIGDGTFNIQPLVPADKVNQNVIKINTGVNINYGLFKVDDNTNLLLQLYKGEIPWEKLDGLTSIKLTPNLTINTREILEHLNTLLEVNELSKETSILLALTSLIENNISPDLSKMGKSEIIRPLHLDTLNTLSTNSFKGIEQLKEALFFSLGAQHKVRRDKILTAYNNILLANNLPMVDSLRELFEVTKNIITSKGTTLEHELFVNNPGENLTTELYFSTVYNPDGSKGYALNNTLLFFFDLFDIESSVAHVPNMDKFSKYHNLGVFEFLYKMKKHNIDASSPEIGLFPKSTFKIENLSKPTNRVESILLDLNSVLGKDEAFESLYAEITEAILSDNLDFLYSDDLQLKITNILQKSSKIYQQYYWENYLFGQNYEMSVNGPIYLHPLKDLPTQKTHYSEILSRLAVSQKRNVDYSATVIPYNYGLNGPARVRQVYVYKDLKRKVSNPMGEIASVDTHDGGELILMLHRILENNSMLGYSNPIFHKPIIHGRMLNLNGDFEDSMLFKYASYLLTSLKLRSSRKLRNMAQYALSEPLLFSLLKESVWDFTRAYNGKSNSIEYGKYNIAVKTGLGNRYKVLLNLAKIGDNDYSATWEDQDGKVTTDNNIELNSLYDLYKLLGAERTVKINKLKEIVEYNENSWIALLDICCKVGFELTEDVLNSPIGLEYARLSGVSLQNLKNNLNNNIKNQQNIIQPLKFSYISQFTPETCIKYGSVIGNANNDFTVKVNLEEDDLTLTTRTLQEWKGSHRIMRVYDMLGGVQQDAEHEGDELTEPTQMINGASLDNQSPEFLDLYKHIANYVIRKMTKTYSGNTLFVSSPERMESDDDYFMTHMRQLAFIYDKLEKQILNSSYDNGNTAAVVLASALNFSKDFISLDRNTKDDDPNKILRARELANKFTVSLSHPSVYNMVITALAAANTKLGIRRMGAGSAAVQLPHQGHMSFLLVPLLESINNNVSLDDGDFMPSSLGKVFNYDNYTTMTADQFFEYMGEHPEYLELTRESNRYSLVWGIDTGVSRWNLNLYNHYVLTTADGSIEELYVKDINVLKSLKQRIYNGEFTNVKQDKLSGFDWSHDQGRDLKHIDFEITVNVPGESDATIIYNIYDTIANEFLLKLQKLDWENQVERNQLIKEFNLVVKEYPNELKMFTQIKSILNKKEFANILRSLLNVEYKLMSEGRKLITADDKALILFLGNVSEIDLLNVVKVKSVDSELIMMLPFADKFKISNMNHLSDITVDSIMNRLNKQYYEVEDLLLKDKNGKKYKIPYFFQADNGNIYLADENIGNSGLESVDPYVYIEDNKKYVTIENKQIIEITSDLEGKLRILYTKNNEPVVVLLTSNLEMNTVGSDKEGEVVDNFKTNINVTFWGGLQKDINEINLSESTFIQNNLDSSNGISSWLDAENITEFTSEEKKKQLAREIYSAYQMVLRFASTRIPGQSYQSFASTRISNFLHGELNAVYVNDYTIWLTGGDYDIDKLYNIGFNLSKGGKFIGWHRFFNASSYEHLKESLKLPGLDNTIKESTNDDAIDLNSPLYEEDRITDPDTGDVFVKTVSGKDLILMILTKNGKMHNQISLKKFKAFVKLYNSLVQKGYKNAELTEFIKETLNHKNVTTFVAADEGKALQNRMITQIRNNLSDIRNVVPTYSPISVGDRSSGPKGLKMNSEKYIGSQLGHPDVPLKRIADVSNQSSGKSVVGIMAAGLKLYATISYVVEDMLYKNLSVEELELMLFSHTATITENGQVVIINVSNGFAGINYEINKDLYELLLSQKGLTPDQVNELIIDHYKRDSVLLNISLLLSAATDNGKEMILGIINSGKETLGIYTYALMTGMSLEDVGSLMTSKEVDFIIKNTKRSILLNDPFKTMIDVGNYFLNPIDLDTFVPFGSKLTILTLLNLEKKEENLGLVSIKDIEKAMESKLLILKLLAISNLSEEEQEYFDEEWSSNYSTIINAYTLLQNYINARKEVEELLLEENSKNRVSLFLTFLNNALLFASTTQVLGANQRVKPNDRELIKFYVSIEDSIRNYLFRVGLKTKGGTDTYILNNNNDWSEGTLNPELQEFLLTFNLWKFMNSTPEEAQKAILLFDKVKSDLNPLLIFYHAEHFREMIKTVLMTDAILKKQSLVYRSVAKFQEQTLLNHMKKKEKTAVLFKNLTTVDVQKKVVLERNLGPEAFTVLKNVMDDKFIVESLHLLQGRLNAEKKTIYIMSEEGVPKLVNLLLLSEENNILGRKEFIKFMEETFIPRLKLGKINDGPKETVNPNIRNNAFITSLQIKDFVVRNKRGERFLAYGVANFKSSDNLLVKLNQNELMIALYDLDNLDDSEYRPTPNSNGTSVIDMLFLYNIILHRGKDGEYTLSSFFDPTKLPSSIVSKFYMLENLVNNTITDVLKVSELDLIANGFDNELLPKLELMLSSRFSTDYRYINMGETTTEEQKRKSLDQKLKTLFESGFMGLNIKFDCI